MNSSIYGRLALTNLRNNRKTYVPYILTAVLTVMMCYIMGALYRNKSIGHGGVQECLNYADKILIIFAVIFLFYTNSFLIKRRKKEIGVYNILGMGKRHISKMMLIETVITAVISIATGLAAGILFSRLIYLLLLRILHYDVNMEFEISSQAAVSTIIVFGIIFAMTLCYNLLQIQMANPVELLHGSNQGEKEPRTKWLLAIFGVIAIGIGYYIALTTESPLKALTMFFLAVVCVVLGTYALFIAGSIAFLKMLKKNKKFYYKAKHFTSVSGMIYRMKQNAVGLANICILSTMVLIMISTTTSLYVGMDDVLKTRFPHEFLITDYESTNESEQKISMIVKEETEKAGAHTTGELSYHYGALTAIEDSGEMTLKVTGDYSAEDVCELYMIPQEDYNQMEEASVSLSADEVLFYTTETEPYGRNEVKLGGKTYHIAKELENMKVEPKNHSRLAPAYYVVFADREAITDIMQEAFAASDMQEEWKQQMNKIKYEYFFDLEGETKACTTAAENINKRLASEVPEAGAQSRELSRQSFYQLYGGLLFIGIYLGLMFLVAMVLIIYYKQISEGYDDRERFQIMQQVGMDKKEVKRSIRSQVLLIFFLPLIVAVIHVAAAFKVVTKLLAVLNLVNVPLFLTCTLVTVAVFALFYVIVFILTEREYYRIVK